jgi:hypothetical protein
VPFAHQILFVRAGMSHAPRAPVYTTLATDAAGRFATLLPAGARFAVVTREKGEARAHALLRAGTNDEARRRVWMRTPAVVIDTRACGNDGDGGGGGRAVVTGAPWPQGASVSVPPEAGAEPSAEPGSESRTDRAEPELDNGNDSGMVFVADQRDPTLPQTHTRDFTIGR